jgi:hypothetical protein
MKEVLLAKEEGLRIALSILSEEKTNKDYGSAALRDTELILKNILETMEVEREMMAKPPLEPKKPNKKRALSLTQKKNQKLNLQAAKDYMGGWKNLTILELEEGNK